jgi:hypothetical protein
MDTFELWDTDTRNLVEEFADEASARAALRAISDFSSLALARRDERGRTEWVAQGAELGRFAKAAAGV